MNARDMTGCVERQLADSGIETARLEARLLVSAALGRTDSIPTQVLDAASEERLASYVRRRIAREPIAYILGHKEFWSLHFEVGPGVLVPRPESELLIEEVQREFPDRIAPLDVLDLGTGSGILLIATLTIYSAARGVGIDCSTSAIRWANRNVELHGLYERCTLMEQNWAADLGCKADAILVNPPYVAEWEFSNLPPEVGQYEPAEALLGGGDGLAAYRSLAPRIAHMLKPGGRAFLEIGSGQSQPVTQILANAGLEVSRISPDLAGIPRCVVCRLRKAQ